ncbi:MAG: CRTAC1 family protein [Deltaproteobacteria bacterium]|nr:CRTAC1 family protein [Deltaproteobacteria bacterium]
MSRPLLLAVFALVACSSKDGTAPNPDTGVDPLEALLGLGPAPTKVGLAPACGATGAATLKYARKTAEWGLDAVLGTRLQAVDLDRDGYPDLLVEGANGRADATKPTARVLMNRPKPGGGRQFVDETVASGVGAMREGTKPGDGKLRSMQFSVAADVDNDGDVDLFSGTYVDPTKPDLDSGDRNEILLNDGKGKLALAPKSAVQTVPTELPPTSGAAFVDADRDGVIDVWVGYWYKAYGSSYVGVQARLFKGKGDGTFADATPGSGLETQSSGYDQGKNHRPAYGVTACDLDGDGASELLLSAYGRQWNLLYKNHTASGAAPAFEEIGQASGFAGDTNVDYSDNQFYQCHCKITGSCTAGEPDLSCGTTSNWSSVDAKPWRNNGNTFSTVCADIDGDGKNDLYSAEIKHWHIGESSDASELLVNDGTDAIHFKRPGRKELGLEWPHPTVDWNEGGITAAAADLDLDGREDVIVGASDYPGNWSLVFRQKDDGTFEEIGQKIGLHHDCAVGIAIADFDRDGDLDAVVASSVARDCAKIWTKGNEVHFYENALNDGAQKHGFLQVALEGKGAGGANRLGVGARVKVVSDGKVMTKELSGGYGHFGLQHDTALTFGLGASCAPTAIEVRWPNGALTAARYTGVGGGRRVLIKESGEVTEVGK